MKSYSQYGQDVALYNNFFKDKKNGYFVEIGAFDGLLLSNTYLFEERGWDGVCVEPMNDAFEQLKKNRKCKCFNYAVTNRDDEYLDFCKITGFNNMLSGVIDSYDDKHKERILRECPQLGTKEKIKVKNIQFNDLITETTIDLLSVDTEGGEDALLNSIDMVKYKIDVILIEDNYSQYRNTLSEQIKDLYKISDISLGDDIVLKRR